VAILYFQKNEEFINLVTKKSIQVLSWAIFLLFCYNQVTFPLSHELVAIATVCIIVAQITGKNKLINLETKVLDFIGRISFGIYITHNLIILYCSKLIGKFVLPNIFNYIFVYFFVITIVILFSDLSYNYFEKFFLRMKLQYAIFTNESKEPKNNDKTITTIY
jgi:peptidoglycan/LPS O-acetylase OafA/YrhL